MDVLRTRREVRAALARRPRPVGLVPTLGALHDGHRSLIRRALTENATIVVWIFVNPRQFGAADLAAYPRDEAADLAMCEAEGVDIVFAPPIEEVYPEGFDTSVRVGALTERLEGASRPGHFEGVTTVVATFFGIVSPDRAYFGEKDAQQLAVIRRLVADFNVPVRIVGVPTVREADGLALSSRNQRLDPAERGLAPALYRALLQVKDGIAAGVTDAAELKRRGVEQIGGDERLRLEYLEIVDPDDFQPVERVTGPVVAAGALWVGATRLIDNVRCTPGES